MSVDYHALPATLGPQLLAAGVDDSGTRVAAFTDREGGQPLRCCLRDSRVGESIVLVSVTPEGPRGAYRETGPVFVHAQACAGPEGEPAFWANRRQVIRAYDHSGRIIGGEVADVGQQAVVAQRLLEDPGVAFVQSRNIIHGCYMLTVRRGAGHSPFISGAHDDWCPAPACSESSSPHSV